MGLRSFWPLVIGLALVLLLAVACGTPQPTLDPTLTAPETPTRPSQLVPTIIEHPRPAFTVDAEIFDTSDSPVIERECSQGVSPSDMYGGLDPKYPTADCYKELEPGDQCLRERDGLFPICERVIVYVGDTFQVITTQEDLKDLFAPIESAGEALSYTLLATGYRAKYDPEDFGGPCGAEPEDTLYHTDVLEDTHVVELASGYEVGLFDQIVFGCGSHPVYSLPVQVNHDGTITEGRRVKLLEINVEKVGDCCVD